LKSTKNNAPVFHTKEFKKKLDAFIDRALKEDVGEKDHTSFACIPAKNKAQGNLLVKTDGIIAGIEVAELIFNKLDKNSSIDRFFSDGDAVNKGDLAFIVNGNARMMHTGERLVLNVMQRMSGNLPIYVREQMRLFWIPVKPHRVYAYLKNGPYAWVEQATIVGGYMI
jgi:Quinolinate phosphoribosyl transferase, N-terminal domain